MGIGPFWLMVSELKKEKIFDKNTMEISYFRISFHGRWKVTGKFSSGKVQLQFPN